MLQRGAVVPVAHDLLRDLGSHRGRPRKDTVGFHVSRKAEERLREYMKRSGLKLGEAVEGAILALRMPRRKPTQDDDV